MKKVILILFSFLLISCTDRVRVLDDEYLPNAYKGKLYQTVIDIKGGKVFDLSFKANISPDNSGLTWEANDNPASIPTIITKDYNRITIKGEPKVSGEIYFDFYWGTYGTNMNTGKIYQKRYILKVEE